MGGRGTFAAGNNVAYIYKTVGKIGGVKVLQKKNESASLGLPEEAHSSKAYVLLDRTGNFKMFRQYDEKHNLCFEIAYHPERKLDPSGRPVLHYHTIDPEGFVRSNAKYLSEEMKRRYKKYFKGIDL